MRFFLVLTVLLGLGPLLQAQTISSKEKGYASYYANYLDGRRTAYGEVYNKNKLTAAHRTYPLGTLVEVTRLDNGKSIIVRINDKGPVDPTRVIDVSYAAAEALDLVYDGIAMVETQVVDADGNPIAAPQTAAAVPEPQAPAAYNKVEVPISYDYKPQFKQPANTTAKSAPASTIPAASNIPGSTPAPSPYQTDLQPKAPLPVAYEASTDNRIETPSTGFFVQVGAFSKRANAESLLNSLSDKGFNNAQIQSSGQLFKALVGPYSNAAEANQDKNRLVRELKLQGFVTEIQ